MSPFSHYSPLPYPPPTSHFQSFPPHCLQSAFLISPQTTSISFAGSISYLSPRCTHFSWFCSWLSFLAYTCSWFHRIHFCIYALLPVTVIMTRISIPPQYPCSHWSNRGIDLACRTLENFIVFMMSPEIIGARGVMWNLRHSQKLTLTKIYISCLSKLQIPWETLYCIPSIKQSAWHIADAKTWWVTNPQHQYIFSHNFLLCISFWDL